MQQHWKRIFVLAVLGAVVVFALNWTFPVSAEEPAQLPTAQMATVTSTPSGVMITVRADADQTQINVRSGPGTYYEKVGVLLTGQQAPAKGRSAGGDWIMIEYPGVQGGTAWVFASLVDLTPGGELPIVEPPPTPTPLVTPTIDPTLAAQFVVTSAPTRLPTFTAPPPLTIPTFQEKSTIGVGGVPMGLVILGLVAVGAVIGLFAFTQGR
ncbi:MAG: SH3 domain-containing protein [Chloroflexi bacterium]|nr:SH3 domain-containing protein [Chloroflexota bacterium]